MASVDEILANAFQYYREGNLPQAELLCRQVLQAQPGQADALHLQGIMAHQGGNHQQAAELIQQAISANPTEPLMHFNLGLVYRALGRLDDSGASYQHALRLRPDYPEAYNNLGNLRRQQERTDEAMACFQQALRLRPDLPEAHNNLGKLLLDLGRSDEAVASFQQASRLRPNNPEAYSNLGAALRRQGREDEAVACYHQALRLRPDYPEVHNNLGNLLRQQGRAEEALAGFDRAIAGRQDYADAHFNRSLVWLAQGDFQRGWPEYEWRLRTSGESGTRGFGRPRWAGQALHGARILLHAEQGLGDTLQFIRYAPRVQQRGGIVLVECQAELLDILKSVAGIDALVARGNTLPDFDFHAPLLSLPHIFGTTLATIPADVPYISVEPATVERWRNRLDGSGPFKVGIVWQGRPQHLEDRWRSFRLESFGRLAQIPGVRLYSLQKGAGREQLPAPRDFEIDDLEPELTDFVETAGAMLHLDLVITCDSAPAHLAGALGRPVWVPLPRVPDWRWLTEREDTPWYPTARLFRQRERGDWEPVFQQMAEELRGLAVGNGE